MLDNMCFNLDSLRGATRLQLQKWSKAYNIRANQKSLKMKEELAKLWNTASDNARPKGKLQAPPPVLRKGKILKVKVTTTVR